VRKLLGNEHPHVATSLNNLAGLYKSQGRYEDAEPLYLDALEICDRSLGSAHPNTRIIWKNYILFWKTALNEGHLTMNDLQTHPLASQIQAALQQLMTELEDTGEDE
ncbi:MAG: tetratricopeptide repeat protein, partial [Cyanobacteriota bacterium]|nr:tetratricopeptide repeat protein [Cyanobacteriota bacterium]